MDLAQKKSFGNPYTHVLDFFLLIILLFSPGNVCKCRNRFHRELLNLFCLSFGCSFLSIDFVISAQLSAISPPNRWWIFLRQISINWFTKGEYTTFSFLVKLSKSIYFSQPLLKCFLCYSMKNLTIPEKADRWKLIYFLLH